MTSPELFYCCSQVPSLINTTVCHRTLLIGHMLKEVTPSNKEYRVLSANAKTGNRAHDKYLSRRVINSSRSG
jgi:hypothetical protein